MVWAFWWFGLVGERIRRDKTRWRWKAYRLDCNYAKSASLISDLLSLLLR